MRCFAAAAACLLATPSFAADCSAIADDAERLACWDDAVAAECVVEDWAATQTSIGKLKMTGAATCADGLVTIRLYDGETFVGADQAVVRGFAFMAFIDGDAADPQPRFSVSR